MTDRRIPGAATGQGYGELNPVRPAGQERGTWAGQPLPRHRPTTANSTSNGNAQLAALSHPGEEIQRCL